MSLVHINNVQILNNPSVFSAPFQFEIQFEVISPLQHDLEFKVIYVGSAETEQYDQVLEQVMVGPVPVGMSKFLLEAPAPKPELIPEQDAVGVTVVLLTCSYQDKEFVRVGYYVNNDYMEEELKENPPAHADFSKLYKSILAEKPRVTRFTIPWDPPVESLPQESQQQSISVMMDA